MDAGAIKPENVARAFGEILRRYRRERSFSQEELAEKCDLDRTYVSMLERGIHQPSLTVLLKLARALNVPATEMVDYVRQRCS